MLCMLFNCISPLAIVCRFWSAAQYQQFHRLYNNQDFKEAGNLVFSLLDSRLAPKE